MRFINEKKNPKKKEKRKCLFYLNQKLNSFAVNPELSITYDGVSVQRHGKEYLGLKNFKLTFTVSRYVVVVVDVFFFFFYFFFFFVEDIHFVTQTIEI